LSDGPLFGEEHLSWNAEQQRNEKICDQEGKSPYGVGGQIAYDKSRQPP
jgi:hypothetical protein